MKKERWTLYERNQTKEYEGMVVVLDIRQKGKASSWDTGLEWRLTSNLGQVLMKKLMQRGYRQSSTAKARKRVEIESCSVLLVDQTKKSENEQNLKKKWFWRSWSVLKSKLDGSSQTQFVVHWDTREPIRELGSLERVLSNGRESRLRTTLVAFRRSLARYKVSIVGLEGTVTYREIVKWLLV